MDTKELKEKMRVYRENNNQNFNARFGDKYLEDVSLAGKDIIGIFNDISLLLSTCELLAEKIEELEANKAREKKKN